MELYRVLGAVLVLNSGISLGTNAHISIILPPPLLPLPPQYRPMGYGSFSIIFYMRKEIIRCTDDSALWLSINQNHDGVTYIKYGLPHYGHSTLGAPERE